MAVPSSAMLLRTQDHEIQEQAPSRTLQCEECSRLSHDGLGWWAGIAFDPDDGEPARVVVYCPDCWVREFSS
jgi:hypothetical protein